MSLLFKYLITGKNAVASSRNGIRSVVDKEFTFQGDVQPVTSRQSLALTDGRISSGMVRVFSETPLVISTEGDTETVRGSYVLHEEKWYEVVMAASWNSKNVELESLNHYDYYAEYRDKEAS